MHYNTTVEIELEPIGNPELVITVGQSIEHTIISSTTTKIYKISTPAISIPIGIRLVNKLDTDPSTAIIIKSIKFNDITDPKFVLQGTYYPDYPETWASTQQNLKLEIPGQTYLGWNGVYKLIVTIPIFTWMHQVKDLGWIFE